MTTIRGKEILVELCEIAQEIQEHMEYRVPADCICGKNQHFVKSLDEAVWDLSVINFIREAVRHYKSAGNMGPIAKSIADAIEGERKIEAIKIMKNYKNCGLKEAKDLVELCFKAGVVDMNIDDMCKQVRTHLVTAGYKFQETCKFCHSVTADVNDFGLCKYCAKDAHYCVVCRVVPVDVANGIDTCDECANK